VISKEDFPGGVLQAVDFVEGVPKVKVVPALNPDGPLLVAESGDTSACRVRQTYGNSPELASWIPGDSG